MGWIVIPVTIGLALVRRRYLLPWAIYLAIFQAASVANFGGSSGGTGISPFYFVVFFILGYLLLDLRRVAADAVRVDARYIVPLAAFVAYAVISANLLPYVLQGIRVISDRVEPTFIQDEMVTTPLVWRISNFAQSSYVVLGAVFTLAILRRAAYSPRSVPGLLRVFYWSGVTVVLFGLYQRLAWAMGLPYPDWLINSNVGWTQNIAQTVGLVHRVSATFVGPSEAGAFLAAWTTFVGVFVAGGKHRFPGARTMLVLGLAVLVMTTAATGYAVAAIMLVVVLFRCVAEIVGRGRFPRRWAFLGLVIVGAAILGAITLGDIAGVVSEELLEKVATSSGTQRLQMNLWGLQLFASTFGLGAGLGSHRSYSLAANLLANMGVVGTLLFLQLAWTTYADTRKPAVVRSLTADGNLDLSALEWACVANLLAMVLALPDIGWPFLWILWGLLLARCEMVAGEAARSFPRIASWRTVAGLVSTDS
jgi:hypothetical protein